MKSAFLSDVQKFADNLTTNDIQEAMYETMSYEDHFYGVRRCTCGSPVDEMFYFPNIRRLAYKCSECIRFTSFPSTTIFLPLLPHWYMIEL